MDSQIVLKAAEALGKIKDPRAVEPLLTALKGKDESLIGWWVANALGEINDPRAIEPLISDLKNTDAGVRQNAVHALKKIKDPRAKNALKARRKQLAKIAGNHIFFIEQGNPGLENALIDALNESSSLSLSINSIEMAQNFLNCGNLKLEDAALAWAKSHDYQIMKIPGRGSVQWGTAR
jgi:hypothetical protein